MNTGIKHFITSEIRKALGRLQATLLLIVKFAFIGVVNMVFWLLPLFLMSYFFLKPISGYVRSVFPEGRISGPSINYGQAVSTPGQGQNALDLRSYLETTRQFLKDARFLKRS